MNSDLQVHEDVSQIGWRVVLALEKESMMMIVS